MSLVQYPDSDSDEDNTAHAIPAQPSPSPLKSAQKRKYPESAQDDLPPLPAAFHDLYATNARMSTSDDPSLHGGRKRAIPHVEGNWPSHVYLEWIPSQTESDSLHALIQHVGEMLRLQNDKRPTKLTVPRIIPSLQSDLGAPLPLHVSLSRTLQIRTENRDHFVDTLRSSVRKAAVSAFPIEFLGLKWVPNFEHNRWFLVLSTKKPAQNELNRLLIACNEAAGRCGHPGLYVGGHGDGPMEDNSCYDGAKRRKSHHYDCNDVDFSDRFHISIAWNLEEPDPEWMSLVKATDLSKHIQSPQSGFDVVKTRVGNVVHNIDLRAARAGQNSGLD
ncbi:U6 snRNA phosphodiesterase Usb1 [Ampelomyces quisqualis]|uniref:U6 snRNA phosphodiesterase n=1 Tax=Ampelomyces quisqualis TaxID=50730 RepID=A0A6A5QCE2_AMPQU|nr:U6 snRNA phosphodiesterase Usb1 [Ampelomyces quisqualis]